MQGAIPSALLFMLLVYLSGQWLLDYVFVTVTIQYLTHVFYASWP